MNIIVISGNMVADPELKSTTSGVTLCQFAVAVTRRYPVDMADFFHCMAWRDQAEFICRNFRKGQRIELRGDMVSRKFEDRDGNMRTAWEVIVNEVGFAGGRKGETKAESALGESVSPDEYKAASFEELSGDDDLPF